jgi:LPXTG-site transpeptidase (sortase) family protein
MKSLASKLFSVIAALIMTLGMLGQITTPTLAAGSVSLTTLGAAYTQDFNTLEYVAATGSTVPTGWDFYETGTNANTTYGVGTGSSNTGNTYSFGSAAVPTDRAFGGLQSGSLIPVIGASFTNNSGGTITSLAIAYTGEEWRLGTINRQDRIDFQYSTDATSLSTGTWIDVDTLDFSTPAYAAPEGTGLKDGNNSAYRTAISSTITGLTISNGSVFWIRWTDFNASGSDDGLAVDDFSLTPSGFIPDTAPSVSSTTPANGDTDVAINGDVSITFSEPVDVTGSWYGLSCATSGTHTVAVTGGPTTFTLNPDADFVNSEVCTLTVYAAQVTDQDTNDPPDNMAANFTSTFTTVGVADTAPSVVSISPSDGATSVGTQSNISVTFSEDVSIDSGGITVGCTVTPTVGVAVSGGPTTFTVDPLVDLAANETCTVTVLASYVHDSDTNDPPDTMAANFVSTFTTDAAPTVTSTTPADGATDIALTSNVVVNFSEAMTATASSFTLSCVNTGVHAVAVSGSGTSSITLNPTVDFGNNETCTLTVNAASISDSDAGDPPDHPAADYVTSFTTANVCSAAYTPIHDIQGNGTSSPIVNTVVTTQGVVTGYLSTFGGFYIQDQAANYDADPLTSEGVFVYSTAYPVAVGDYVRVTGKVTEYQTVTELGTITNVTKCQAVTPLSVTSLTLPLPVGATLEPYEGMYVQFVNPFVVAQNYFLGRYGQMHISTRRFFNPTNGQGDTTDEFLRSSIVLDDGKSSQNPSPTPYMGADNTVRAGDTLAAGLTGYIDQGSINSTAGIYGYRLQPVPASVSISRTNPRPSAPSIAGSTLKVVGFNVENYFVTIDKSPYPVGSPYYYISSSDNNTPRGADSATEFTRQRNKLFAGLVAINPDVFGVTELEAWTGAASQADFVAGLNAAPGVSGTYAFIPDPATGYGSDAIKNGLFYKVGSVTPVGPSMSSTDPIYKRAPIAQTFVDNNGAVFSVIVNHFKSKGSCPTDSSDPEAEHGQGCWNVTRVAEATALLAFIEQVKTASGDPDVLVIGDLNSYGVEDPINTLTSGGLINEMSFVPAADRYSYIFDGYSGYLDHALASASMHFQVMGVQPWHINSDEPSIIDYNTEFKGTGSYPPDLYSADAYRASDHDPIVIGLALDSGVPAALVTNPINGTTLVNVKISELTAMFSEDVIHDSGADAADNPANYMLVENGLNNVFDTLTCEQGVQTDDKEITINSISYDPETYTAVLSVNGGAYLPEGDYRLFVCGTTSIHDLAGNVLNGGEFDTISDFGIRFPVDYVAPSALPATGFAPDRVTTLPAQTVSYAELGDLWLEIPSLHVKTPIVGVPQTGESWDVTWLGSQAGWLQGSAYPTALGNSVLTAHVWDALNKPGAFYALNTLAYGDRVIVHSYGKTYTYEIRNVLTVSPTNVNAMLKHQEESWLTLVTCLGWNETNDEYNYRTLVRAILVDVR